MLNYKNFLQHTSQEVFLTYKGLCTVRFFAAAQNDNREQSTSPTTVIISS